MEEWNERESVGGVEQIQSCVRGVDGLFQRFKKRNPLLCFFNDGMKRMHRGHRASCLCA